MIQAYCNQRQSERRHPRRNAFPAEANPFPRVNRAVRRAATCSCDSPSLPSAPTMPAQPLLLGVCHELPASHLVAHFLTMSPLIACAHSLDCMRSLPNPVSLARLFGLTASACNQVVLWVCMQVTVGFFQTVMWPTRVVSARQVRPANPAAEQPTYSHSFHDANSPPPKSAHRHHMRWAGSRTTRDRLRARGSTLSMLTAERW